MKRGEVDVGFVVPSEQVLLVIGRCMTHYFLTMAANSAGRHKKNTVS